MPLPIDMLFAPTWLALLRPLVQPDSPASWWAPDGCPLFYARSRLTARCVTSDMAPTASGTIVSIHIPTRAELLAHEARVVGARRARKAARAAEQAGRHWWRGHLEARAERRAAKSARRIMVLNRRRASDAPTWEEM